MHGIHYKQNTLMLTWKIKQIVSITLQNIMKNKDNLKKKYDHIHDNKELKEFDVLFKIRS